MERALNALGVWELSRHAPTEAPQHDERPRPPVSSASEKLNSENWKEIELNYCGARVKGSYKVSEKLVTGNLDVSRNGARNAANVFGYLGVSFIRRDRDIPLLWSRKIFRFVTSSWCRVDDSCPNL